MDIIKAMILGFVQGVTEFLPISSSGHLSLFTHFFGIESESSGLFSAMLHIGTLVAILITFYKPLYELFVEFFAVLKDVSTKNFQFDLRKMSETRRMLFYFIISCIPLLLLLLPVGNGKNLMDLVGVFGSDSSIKAEGLCFMFTGFFLLLGSITSENAIRTKRISPFSALMIGIAQFIAACFPGISRSGSTISAALCCRVSKKNAVRYSFILSVPAVLAGALVEFKDALETTEIIPIVPLLVGVITSAVVGIFAIKLLQIIVKKNLFKYFGFYCLGLGFVVSIIGAIEVFVK